MSRCRLHGLSEVEYAELFSFYEMSLIGAGCRLVWTGDTEVTMYKMHWTGSHRTVGKYDYHKSRLCSLYYAWLDRDHEPAGPTEQSVGWLVA